MMIENQEHNPIPPGEQPKSTEPVRRGIVVSAFESKTSSFFTLLLVGFIWNFFSQVLPVPFSALGPLSSIALFVVIVIALKATGRTHEADNALRAVGLMLLIALILLVVGFGICLLALR